MNHSQIVNAARISIEALIAHYPDLADDDQLRIDMIEGETDFNRIMARLIRLDLEAKADAEAIKSIKNEYAERQKRAENRSAAYRDLMIALMNTAGVDKLPLPEGTVSILSPRTRVSVVDVNELPQGFFKTERKPLSDEIKTALMNGEAVPGAELTLGEQSVMVRVK